MDFAAGRWQIPTSPAQLLGVVQSQPQRGAILELHDAPDAVLVTAAIFGMPPLLLTKDGRYAVLKAAYSRRKAQTLHHLRRSGSWWTPA